MAFSINQIVSLKRGVTKYGAAPHKPILLLAVIEQFEIGELNLNWIEPTPELVTRFQDLWKILVKTRHIPTFALPFFHLRGEKKELWQHVIFPGKQIPVTNSKSIKSYKALCETVAAAKLNEDFYTSLIDPIKREEIKQVLLNTYFPNHRNTLKEIRYSTQVKKQILCDPSENYAKKVKQKLAELKPEEAEQEIIVRSATFKKAIVDIYQGKCAISGLDIRYSKNVNMVDACHIIPFAESYDDTIKNGIALSPTFHRAFDRGLIAISNDYTTLIHKNVIDQSNSYGLKAFENKAILLPSDAKYYPELGKLKLHRERFGF